MSHKNAAVKTWLKEGEIILSLAKNDIQKMKNPYRFEFQWLPYPEIARLTFVIHVISVARQNTFGMELIEDQQITMTLNKI